MSEKEQLVVLPVSVFNQVTDYLVKQPYAEIQGLIELLREHTKAVQQDSVVEENVSDE